MQESLKQEKNSGGGYPYELLTLIRNAVQQGRVYLVPGTNIYITTTYVHIRQKKYLLANSVPEEHCTEDPREVIMHPPCYHFARPNSYTQLAKR